jgi:hypothetical protein
MGENKMNNDQKVETTTTDQQQIYGGHQQGNYNLEETAPVIKDEKSGEGVFTKKQDHIRHQHTDHQDEEVFSDSYKMDNETYQYSTTGRLDKNEKAEMISSVEGDFEDILGETENARRNEKVIRADENNQGNPKHQYK